MSTHRFFSLVFLRKIPSGKSFNLLFCNSLPTNNHNQRQLHDKRRLCVLGSYFPNIQCRIPRYNKQERWKNKNGKKTKLSYRRPPMLFLSLEKYEIPELWDSFSFGALLLFSLRHSRLGARVTKSPLWINIRFILHSKVSKAKIAEIYDLTKKLLRNSVLHQCI